MPNDDDSSPLSHETAAWNRDHTDAYDSAPLPLVSVGADGAIRSANLAAAQLLRQEPGSLINRQLASFVHEADRRRLRENLVSQGYAVRRACEVRLTLPNGSLLPVQLYARASWRVPGVEHLSLMDLRERELDAWEKQQLRQAAVQARAGNHAKDRLIALLSHELRSKLVPLRAAAVALRRTPAAGGALRSTLEQIESSLSAEARLLDELLDVAASAKGTMRIVRRLVDVNLLVDDCVESVQAVAERKGVLLSFVPAADQADVSADRSRLRLIFSTLLTTAVQVTPPGGRVSVRTRNSQGRLIAEVRDGGAGFDPEEASRLVSTLDGLRDPAAERGGLDLGLALVKALVELHGGRLTASSAGKHRGRCFMVELHLAAEAETELYRNEQLSRGDSGVMPRYEGPGADKLGVR